jgi:uncharacterized protein YraI
MAVSVPAALVAWPGSTTTPETIELGTGEGNIDREAALGRGSVDRTPRPSATPDAFTATPDVEANETPEEEPTETPEPEPTESPEEEPSEAPEPEPEPTVAGQMYATTSLNVRTGPATNTDSLAVLSAGSEVDVTGETDGDWTQILYDGDVAWVSSDYLSEEKPSEETDDTEDNESGGNDDGISSAECPTGSSVESGLTPDAIRVHRAVCHRFPQIDTYHGMRSGGGAHSEGRALDIMVRGSLGDEIAEWVRANYQELGVSEVIWEQRIWTVQRSSEGWRPMEDRGSDTANHYDHVHVTVYGDRGTS